MSFIEKRRGRGNPQGSNPSVLTARMFLGKDGHKAYVTPIALIKFVDEERIEDVQQMEDFIDLVAQKRKFSLNLRERKDAGGKPYLYQNFLSSMGPEGKKVLVIGEIKRFIADYHRGSITIDFSFEQLVDEAEQES